MNSKIEIILTGTGGSEPVYFIKGGKNWSRHHPGAMIFIKRGDKKFGIKIDHHVHSDINMFNARVAPSDIDILLISHVHEDHLNYRFFASKMGECPPRGDALFNRKPVSVYSSKIVIHTIIEMMARKNIFPFEFRKEANTGHYHFRSLIYPRKKILTLYHVNGNTLITPFPKLKIKFISARHFHQSAFASCGFGKKAFGFLIIDEELQKSLLYMTDYADMNGTVKEIFFESLKDYKIDIFILGMPVPLREKKEQRKHMDLEKSLQMIEELYCNGDMKEKPKIVLTHLSDRWILPESVKQAEKIIKKYNFEVWIPPKDGVTIEISKKKTQKKRGWNSK